MDAATTRLDDYVALGRVSACALAPGCRWLAVVIQRPDDEKGRFRSALWKVPVDPGEEATLLVGADRNARSPAFGGDGALYFLGEEEVAGAEGGKRLDQVLRWTPRGVEALTDAPRGVTAFRVARAGDRLAWTAPRVGGVPEGEQRAAWLREQQHGPGARHFRRPPARFWNHWLGRGHDRIFVAGLDGRAPCDLGPEGPRALFDAAWCLSDDGRTLVHGLARPGTDRLDDIDVVVHDLQDGGQRTLAAPRDSGFSDLILSPDGRLLAAVLRERRPGRRGPDRLVRFDLSSPSPTPVPVAPAWDRWPVPVGFVGPDLVVLVREDARQRLYRLEGDQPRLLHGDGVVEGATVVLAPDGGPTVVALHHDLFHPPRPALFDATGGLRRLSVPADAEVPLPVVAVEERRTPSPAGGEVHSLILWPEGPGPHPTLFQVHGGPVSHWADWWHWRWNAALFVAHGYAVVLPNPRGSTGYGQAWVEGIWDDAWGGACVDDLLAVLGAVGADPRVDTARVGLVGASFGGWMANHLGGRASGWRCVVSHAGIFDDRAFSGSTDVPPYWHWEHGGSPWRTPGFGRWSPHQHVGGWAAPTLVVHGEKDYRVPIEQGLSLFEALLDQGVDAELLAFPDEGHWIERPQNVAAWHRVVLDFLARHLGGRPPVGGGLPAPGW